MNDSNSGFTKAPTVDITNGGGSGATATAKSLTLTDSAHGTAVLTHDPASGGYSGSIVENAMGPFPKRD